MKNSYMSKTIVATALAVAVITASTTLAFEPPSGGHGPRGPMAGPRPGDAPPPPQQDDGDDDRPGRPFRDGPRGRMGDRPFRDASPEMKAEAMDRAMEMLQEKFPVLHQRLTKLREDKPERFERAMGKFSSTVMDKLGAIQPLGVVDQQPEGH